MLQVFWSGMRHLRRILAQCRLTESEQWRMDPLSHPALRRMDQGQLGDLPIGHTVLPERLTDRC